MLTADTITDVDLRGLLHAFSFQSNVWNKAEAALKGDRDARQWCAELLEAHAVHLAATGNTSLYCPSMDARAIEILNARTKAGGK